MKFLLVIALAVLLFGCTGYVINDDSYTIGALMPMSGPNSDVYGEFGLRGIQIAIDEINSNGGVDGKNLNFILEDSMAQSTQAINAFQSLVARNVPAVIGDITVVSLYVAPFAEESKTVLLAPGSAVPSLRDAGDYVFRAKLAGDVESFELAKDAINVLNAKKAAIIVKNSDFGVGLGNAFNEKFRELGGLITNYEKYETGDLDFKTYLAKINAKNPDVVFLVCHQEEGGMIVKQARELGIDIPIIINPSSWGPAIRDIAGKASDGIYSFYEFDMDGDFYKTKNFREKFISRYGDVPTVHTYLAYDSVYIIADMLKICGMNSTCIKDGLYGVDYTGASGRIRFDQNGDVIRDEFELKVFKDGEFVDV